MMEPPKLTRQQKREAARKIALRGVTARTPGCSRRARKTVAKVIAEQWRQVELELAAKV